MLSVTFKSTTVHLGESVVVCDANIPLSSQPCSCVVHIFMHYIQVLHPGSTGYLQLSECVSDGYLGGTQQRNRDAVRDISW